MNQVDVLLARAKQRADQMGLPYAGALLPAEAFELLQAIPDARLIDVRTRAEWDWVGRIPSAAMIEWNGWPGGERNPRFVDELRASVPDSSSPLLFICRSGVRSHNAAAAATLAGYSTCFNVLEGFEGDRDAEGHRNTIGGWRAAGLPWIQG